MKIKGKLISYRTIKCNGLNERYHSTNWYGSHPVEHFKSAEEKIEHLKKIHQNHDEEMFDIKITDEEFEVMFV